MWLLYRALSAATLLVAGPWMLLRRGGGGLLAKVQGDAYDVVAGGTPLDQATFRVIVTSPAGSVTSNSAVLTVSS